MARKKSLQHRYSSPTKNQVIATFLTGLTVSEVARLFGIPWSSCKDIIKHYLKTGTTHYHTRSGRHKRLTNTDVQQLLEFVKENRRMPFKEVAKNFTPLVSTWTIRRVLWKEGYGRCCPKRVPYLSPEHRKKRLDYAKELEWLGPRCYDYFIYSDEAFIVAGENPDKIYDGIQWFWHCARVLATAARQLRR